MSLIGMGLAMPLLTLSLQEAFPRSELGVVINKSKAINFLTRSIGINVYADSQPIDNQISNRAFPTAIITGKHIHNRCLLMHERHPNR